VVSFAGAELLELLLLRSGRGRLAGGPAGVDDARIQPDLERVVRRKARTAVAHARTRDLQAQRHEEQRQRRRQPAHDDGDAAQAQDLPAGPPH
jgi:hypothetical protein